jgi:anti-sigma regulatory factor (Ser/Thr protein kinase)
MDLLPWLASQLGISEASLHRFKNCAAELFNNIKDHTQFDIGSIFVQHFPNEKSVTIAMSDFGIGIPARVREKRQLPDAAAIIEAVKEGFTTKSSPRNKGIGLDYLLKTVVLGNGGRVTVYSGRGIVRFDRVGTEIRPFAFQRVGFCPGTTFELRLRTNAIEVLPDEREELQWSES